MIWARQAGSFWLKIGTPHPEPVAALGLEVGPDRVGVAAGEGRTSVALGTMTTWPAAVQQRTAEFPLVKLLASTSASFVATAGCTAVSAIQSSNWSGGPAPWFSSMKASLRWSRDQAGFTTQSPFGTEASSTGVPGLDTSM